MTPIDTSAKLSQLRVLLDKHELAAYYIPSEDAHQVSANGGGHVYDSLQQQQSTTRVNTFQHATPVERTLATLLGLQVESRRFTQQTTDETGFAIVTRTQAALWTDGRYFLQAAQQLDANWTLMKAGLPDTPTKEVWLKQTLTRGDRVGVDPSLISYDASVKLSETLAQAGLQLASVADNLVDAVWPDQPSFAPQPIEHLPVQFAGRATSAKLAELRSHLQANSLSAMAITALDEIACTLQWMKRLSLSSASCRAV